MNKNRKCLEILQLVFNMLDHNKRPVSNVAHHSAHSVVVLQEHAGLELNLLVCVGGAPRVVDALQVQLLLRGVRGGVADLEQKGGVRTVCV